LTTNKLTDIENEID
jgi:hypothetical protein